MNAKELETMLRQRLKAEYAEVRDESARHRGHAGPRQTGGGHYEACVVSRVFQGLQPVERHRAVYSALQNEMKAEIHALSLKLFTPEEWLKRGGK